MATVIKSDVGKVVRYTSKAAHGFKSISCYGQTAILLAVDERRYRVRIKFSDGMIYQNAHLSDVTLNLDESILS